MLVRVLEVGLVALIALALLAPLLRGAVRRAWTAAAGAGEFVGPATGRDESRRRWAGWVGGVLLAIAIMNGLAYSVHTSELGGSADSRKQAEGRYFVSAHGKYTEVTEEEWRAVRAHGIAKNVTHVLGLVVGGALLAYSQRWWSSKTAAPGTSLGGDVEVR